MLSHFLQSLDESGRAVLAMEGYDLRQSIDQSVAEKHDRAALRLLEDWHEAAVLDLPGSTLNFHQAAALWGAKMLFRAACLVAYRNLEASDIARWLNGDPMPDTENPAAHFSADLCLRHWASLYRMARSLSEDDPLVASMETVAKMAPLSAPGMHLGADANHSLFLHSGLIQLFAERALERSDSSCLSLPAIHTLAYSKLGSYAAELGRGLLTTNLSS